MGQPSASTIIADREVTLEDLDRKDRALFRAWLQRYCDLGETIKELKVKQDEIKNEKIETLRASLGLRKIDTELAVINHLPGKKSLDQERLKRYLFDKGKVPMRVILAAFEEATSTGQPYTQITPRKDKTGG